MIEEVDGVEVFVEQVQGRMSLSITDRDNFFTYDEVQVVQDEAGSVLKTSKFVTFEDFVNTFDQTSQKFN